MPMQLGVDFPALRLASAPNTLLDHGDLAVAIWLSKSLTELCHFMSP